MCVYYTMFIHTRHVCTFMHSFYIDIHIHMFTSQVSIRYLDAIARDESQHIPGPRLLPTVQLRHTRESHVALGRGVDLSGTVDITGSCVFSLFYLIYSWYVYGIITG